MGLLRGFLRKHYSTRNVIEVLLNRFVRIRSVFIMRFLLGALKGGKRFSRCTEAILENVPEIWIEKFIVIGKKRDFRRVSKFLHTALQFLMD